VQLSRDPAARRRLAALASGAALALAAGVAVGAGSGGCAGGGAAPRGAPQPPPVDALSLRRQVGQLLVSSFDGTSVPSYLERRLRAAETAGVIVFARNGGGPGE
jgi:beta-N-acetylhexosaminidase